MRLARALLCFLTLVAAARATAPDGDDALPAVTPQPGLAANSTAVDLQASSTSQETTSASMPVPVETSGEVVAEETAPTTSAPSSPLSTPAAATPGTVEVGATYTDSTAYAQGIVHVATDAVTSDLPTSSSPPSAAPEPSPPPSPAEPPPHDLPVAEELPLTEAPPAPEFLSFNEWRERYVVHPDPSHARRAKKRGRQDGTGAGGATGGTEREGLDGLLPVHEGGVAAGPIAIVEAEGQVGIDLVGKTAGVQTQIILDDGALPLSPSSSSASSPIQPLADVGTGEPSDPLIHLKDRANYAGAECAAKLHRSSRQSKGASSILTEKKDRYMLTPCTASPKFVDVELCDEIQIDTLVLANFEFFSSTFKHFKASCSVDYPGKPEDWHDLGTFRARNVRGLQVFRPHSNPPFCRYIRIDFLSNFGSEYYCPVSLLRVYGYTQMEAFRESERKAKAIEEALAAAELVDDEVDERERALESAVKIEVDTLEPRESATTSAAVTASQQEIPLSESALPPASSAAPSETTEPSSTATPLPSSPVPLAKSTSLAPSEAHSSVSSPAPASPSPAPASSVVPAASLSEATHTSSSANPPATVASLEPNAATAAIVLSNSTTANLTSVHASAESSSSVVTTVGSSAQPSPWSSSVPVSPTEASGTASSASQPASSSASSNQSATTTPAPATTTSSSSTVARTATGRPAAPSDAPVASPRQAAPPVASMRNDTHLPRAPVPHPHPPAPVPLAQPQPGESIYGTIMKRLASLEHNQTLAMGFIEAQSGMLREAFGRVERRLSEVEGSRSRQEQSIRQSLLDLEKQRFELERERLALATQISLLTEEVRFEKRLTVAQLVGLLLLVIFVGFTRGVPSTPFLHLATASSAQASARTGAKRKAVVLGEEGSAGWEKERAQQRTAERDEGKVELAGDEAPRRTHRISPSASLSRHQSAKRYPSISKPGALRRHYGPGPGPSSSSSKGPARTWTPPVRHSSAPPEAVLGAAASSLADAARRRVVPRGALGTSASRAYEFPPRSPGSSGAASPAREARAQPPPALGLPLPLPRAEPHLTHALAALRARDHMPSSADEADTERPHSGTTTANASGTPLHAVRFGAALPGEPTASGLVSPLESVSGFDGYQTYSSDDDSSAMLRPRAPVEKGKGKARVSSPSSPSSSAASGSSPRPPKPNVPPRPATAIGIRFPSLEDVPRQEVRFVSSALPSPPPEPEPELSRQGDAKEITQEL